MEISFAKLHQLGFAHSHQIALDSNGLPRFLVLKGSSVETSPAVYIWLAHAAEAETGEVLYVGKAGKGVVRRCGQHQGGFIYSGTGRKNAAALCEILADPTLTVTVMARTSETVTLFGKTVSMYATEEDALCSLFAPRLNRAVFPDVAGQEVKVKDAVLPDRSDSENETQESGAFIRVASRINSRLRVQDEGTIDDMLAQIEAYGPEDLRRLERMLEFFESRLLSPEHSLKLVGGYTEQPKGCNGVTTLGFGLLQNSNFKANGWIARIYLTASPRLSFPLRFLAPAAHDRVEKTKYVFTPLDLDAFLETPSKIIQSD